MDKDRTIKIWVDDMRPKPDEYDIHIKSVWEFIRGFRSYTELYGSIVVDLDHDSGEYNECGGDYIEILRFLQKYASDDEVNKFTFRLHTANPPARDLMYNIIERNCWKYSGNKN